MTIRKLGHDEWTGMTTWHEYDPLTKQTHIHTTPDQGHINSILDNNKRLYNDDDKGWSPTKEWRRVADIPAWVIHSWLVNDKIDVFNENDWPAVKRKLNSSEWLYLRTAPGKV